MACTLCSLKLDYLGTGRKDSLESNESLGDTFLKDDDDMKTPESPEDVSTEMTSMSNDCSRSMEALNISPGEDSAENEEILSTISEEGDES